jgi:hypothetical protein
MPPAFELSKVAEADFPSRFGQFRIYGFEGRTDGIVDEASAAIAAPNWNWPWRPSPAKAGAC